MQNLSLESFDAFEAAQTAVSDDYEEGFAAGQAEAIAQQDAAQDLLRQEMAQNLADLHFTFAEAQSATLAAFGPLMDAVLEKVLPAISDQAFRSQIMTLISEAAENCGAAALQLTVHPAQFDVVAALALNGPPKVDVKADPAIAEKAGWVAAANYESCFDLAVFEQDLTHILQAIAPAPARMNADG